MMRKKGKGLWLPILLVCLLSGVLILSSCGEHTHSWTNWTITVQPSCNTVGSQSHTCTVCGLVESQNIPAVSHIFGEWEMVSQPTCNHVGYKKQVCVVCQYEKTEEVPEVNEHNWGDWLITTQPTCESKGIQTRVCLTCKISESEYVDAKGHSYSSEWSFNENFHWHDATCEHSNLAKDSSVHDWVEDVITPATCTEAGVKHKYCRTCGYDVGNLPIPATGHTTYASNYTYDKTGHWYPCFFCGARMNFQAHDIQNDKCTACPFKPTTLDALELLLKSDGTWAVIGVKMPLTEIDIPATYENKRITEISAMAFTGQTQLTKITLPLGIQIIDAMAFSGCTGLTEINIPYSVSEIGMFAFEGCTNLATVRFVTGEGRPSGLCKIGVNVFAGCTALTEIDIPAAVTEIPDSAFEGCVSLTRATLPAGLTVIGEKAFAGCTLLSEADIPASVTEIGASAFEGCAITRAIIPVGVTVIEDSTFAGCSALATLSLPEGLISIGANAFDGCTPLTEAVIPATVVEIGVNAFRRTSLTHVEMSDTWCSYNAEEIQIDILDPIDPAVNAQKLITPDLRWEVFAEVTE